MATGKNSRFAMMHPTRVHGIVTVNNTATESLGRFTDRLKVQQLWSIHTQFICLGPTQCFEEGPEGWPERKASVPMMMDGCQKMQFFSFQECGQFCRSVQEEERVHDRAQQSDQVGNFKKKNPDKQVRRAVDNGDEVEVCWRHRGNPQGDEAWSLQHNQGKMHFYRAKEINDLKKLDFCCCPGGRSGRAVGRVHGKGC